MKGIHVSSNLCHLVIPLSMAKSIVDTVSWKKSSTDFSLFQLKISYTVTEILSFPHTSCYFKISGSPTLMSDLLLYCGYYSSFTLEIFGCVRLFSKGNREIQN